MAGSLSFCVAFFGFLFFPGIATASETYALQSDVDHVWTMIAAGLVLTMQGGFLLLEAGQVRSKNAINVAQKNLIDFVFACAIYGVVGYSLMFGASQFGLWGWSWELAFLNMSDDWNMTFFVFQVVFAGTAATIVSGAVAERMSMAGYIIATLLICGLIYPIVGHWAWGGALSGSDSPLLASWGFMDFAGSTVVHSVGAWAGLAAMIIIGPRLGKFDENGKAVMLQGHSPVLSSMGLIILWTGWIGFNGGSTTAGTSAFAGIVANTIIAGAFGGAAQFVIGRLHRGYNRPEFIINGVLSGLVAITAGCDVLDVQASALLGVFAATLSYGFREALENQFKLDDPLGAVAVHGCAGAIGTVMIAFLAPAESLITGDRLSQFLVQLQGVGLVFAWVFGISFAALKAINALLPNPDGPGRGLRIPREDEEVGLNISEHRAPLGMYGLVKAMAAVANDPTAKVQPVTVDSGDESAEAATLFNTIMEQIAERNRRDQANSASSEAISAFQEEIRATMADYGCGDFHSRVSTDNIPQTLLPLAQSINESAEAIEHSLNALIKPLVSLSKGDLSDRVDGEYRGAMEHAQNAVNTSLTSLGEIITDIGAAVAAAAAGDFSKTLDVETRQGYLRELCQGINQIAASAREGCEDASAVIRAIARGELDHRMRDTHTGVFGDIARDVGNMADVTADIVAKVTHSVVRTNSVADDVSDSAGSMLKNAQRQVDMLAILQHDLEDLTHQVSEISARVETAVDLSSEATAAANAARKVTEQSQAKLSDMFSVVDDVVNSVAEIDQLAMQTRLLSLNASVEAARAQDRSAVGFKVVAEEVRQLADESSLSADRIREAMTLVTSAMHDVSTAFESTNAAVNSINSSVEVSNNEITTISGIGQSVNHRMGLIENQLSTLSLTFQNSMQTSKATVTSMVELKSAADNAQSSLGHFENIDAGRIDDAA